MAANIALLLLASMTVPSDAVSKPTKCSRDCPAKNISTDLVNPDGIIHYRFTVADRVTPLPTSAKKPGKVRVQIQLPPAPGASPPDRRENPTMESTGRPFNPNVAAPLPVPPAGIPYEASTPPSNDGRGAKNRGDDSKELSTRSQDTVWPTPCTKTKDPPNPALGLVVIKMALKTTSKHVDDPMDNVLEEVCSRLSREFPAHQMSLTWAPGRETLNCNQHPDKIPPGRP